MEVRNDLTGNNFDRLTVVSFAYKKKGKTYWLCKCDCGKTFIALGSNFGRGTKSCGCDRNFKARNRLKIHGLSKSPEYRVWSHIIGRCYNPLDKGYFLCGGSLWNWFGSLWRYLLSKHKTPPLILSDFY